MTVVSEQERARRDTADEEFSCMERITRQDAVFFLVEEIRAAADRLVEALQTQRPE